METFKFFLNLFPFPSPSLLHPSPTMNDPPNNLEDLNFSNILHIHKSDKEEPPLKNAPNEFSLIAKVLPTKNINMNAFKTTIIKAWNPINKLSTNLLKENTMTFIFEDEKDFEKVLNSTWSFRDHHVSIARWLANKALTEISLTKTNIWIHAFGILVSWIDLDMAQGIGNLSEPSIQVEINVLKPLTTSMILSYNGRTKIFVEIRYERLTDICFKCGQIGRKNPNCPENVELSDENILEPKYGPWMKAKNSHIHN
ncbi:hypothetical protein CASFOL_017416 [Castilleja foliolosa]|uniref:CCHC-type domain-containing protein n=1 Tax=Castilleja foliolosa TaxID=1961234 RepID=A0ABD3DCE4_9LAMI